MDVVLNVLESPTANSLLVLSAAVDPLDAAVELPLAEAVLSNVAFPGISRILIPPPLLLLAKVRPDDVIASDVPPDGQFSR